MEIQVDIVYSEDQVEAIFNKLLIGDFAASYSTHFEHWRSQTQEELLSGEKLAIGAWTVPDEITGKREDLVGICIMRKSDALIEPELVLEAIYVDNNYRNPHYYQSSDNLIWNGTRQPIGSSLLKRAEKLSQKYGYCRIVTEISILQSNLVFFLLRQQFVIIGYDSNKNHYRLVKYIEPVYNKDPYDIKMIVEWLCDQWRFSIKKWVDQDHLLASFTIGKNKEWEMDVHAIVCHNSADLKRKVVKTDRSMYFVLFKTEEDQIPDGAKEQMFFVQPTQIKRETRNQDIDLTLQDYAAAVVVSIRKELFNRFKLNRRQAFLDGAEYGHVLMNRIRSNDRHVFIVFSNSESNNQEIFGVGRILSVETKTPDEIWGEFGKSSTFERKEEFDRYSNIKTRMTAFVFDQLEVDIERLDLNKELSARGWFYMSDEQFYRQVLSRGNYPQTLKLTKGLIK